MSCPRRGWHAQNLRERTFWSRTPEETYNYVFYIVSTAVIGENPKGFDVGNPLAELDR
jgi:hypothetical protein